MPLTNEELHRLNSRLQSDSDRFRKKAERMAAILFDKTDNGKTPQGYAMKAKLQTMQDELKYVIAQRDKFKLQYKLQKEINAKAATLKRLIDEFLEALNKGDS